MASAMTAWAEPSIMQTQGKVRMGGALQGEGRVKCTGPWQSASEGESRRRERPKREGRGAGGRPVHQG